MPSDSRSEATVSKSGASKVKSTRPSKHVILRLSPASLTSFPSDNPKTTSSDPKSPSSPPPSELQSKSKDETPQSSVTDSKTASAPQEKEDESTPVAAGPKRKSLAGAKPGSKRAAQTDTDGTPKPKGRPGPKKKKLDGENGVTGSAPAPHKLGPKANQGAINAGLRALDRKGKPCRKWNKQGISLKTFTGVNWNLPYWQTPKQKSVAITGDVQSETTGSSDAKVDRESSAVNSEPSNAAKDVGAPLVNDAGAASSPVGPRPVEEVAAA